MEADPIATHNRYFETIEHVIDAVESQFQLWSKPNPALKKLYAIIKVVIYKNLPAGGEHLRQTRQADRSK